MPVKIDLIEDAGMRETETGLEVTRIAYVSGLIGDKSARMYQALIEPGVPPRLEPHPTIPGVRVDERFSSALCDDSAKVTLIYRSPNAGSLDNQRPPEIGDPPQITVGAALVQTTTQKDSSGEEMDLTYTPTQEEIDNGELQDMDYPVIGTANQFIPQVTVNYRRRGAASPGSNAKRFVGKTNSTTVFGDPAGTWLCTRIIGQSNDNGATYVVDYEFQFADNLGLDQATNIGWNVILRAEKDGKPQVDPVSGTNIKEFQIYERDEFNDLGL